tara:strand:- start:195 stop:446 length:252 start_codon:yes stop_codon:yes gene_type:complete
MIDLIKTKEDYGITFYIVNTCLHIIPLFILCYLKEIHSENALRTGIILFYMYYLYLKKKGKTVIDPYINDKLPRDWSDLRINP